MTSPALMARHRSACVPRQLAALIGCALLTFVGAACGASDTESDAGFRDHPEPEVDDAECEDPMTYSDDISFTEAWLLLNGPVSVEGKASVPGYTRIELPPETESLHATDSSDGEWPGVARSDDVSTLLPVETIEEGIEAINRTSNPVLVGVIHFVSYDAWGITTMFDVHPDGSLTRLVACADFQRDEVVSYWAQARDAGFEGSQLDFTVIASEALLEQLAAEFVDGSP